MVEESGKKLENSWSELEENDLARLKLAVNALRHSRDRKNLPRTDASIRTLIEKELNSETPSVATLYCLQFLGWLGPDEHAAAVLEEIVKEGNSSVLVPMAFWALATIRPNRRTLLLGRAALHLPMHGTFSDCWIKSLQETIMCVPFQRNDLIDVLIGLAEGSDLSLGEWARARLEEINQCHTYEPAEIPIRTIQARKTGTEAVKRGEAAFAWAHSLFSASTVRGEA